MGKLLDQIAQARFGDGAARIHLRTQDEDLLVESPGTAPSKEWSASKAEVEFELLAIVEGQGGPEHWETRGAGIVDGAQRAIDFLRTGTSWQATIHASAQTSNEADRVLEERQNTIGKFNGAVDPETRARLRGKFLEALDRLSTPTEFAEFDIARFVRENPPT